MSEKFSHKFLILENKKIEINRFIGEGSLGGTWEIKNELGYPKALKILYKIDKNDTQKFLKKCYILKQIIHPNLLKIDTYGTMTAKNVKILVDEYSISIAAIHDCPYIIMPYASINLADYIVLHKENLLERIKLTLQLLRGIRKIHAFQIHGENNIVKYLRHGNLKYSNILLVSQNKSYRLKVADLGIDTLLNIDELPFESKLIFPEIDDFFQLQKIVRELFSFDREFFEFLPQITDGSSVEKAMQCLRSHEKKVRQENLAHSYVHLGIKLYSQSLLNYALKDFEKAIEIDAQIYEAHLYKGHIFKEIGKNEEAVQCYHQAIHINETDPRAYEGRSEAFANQNKEEEAIADLHKAIALDSKLSFCHAALGMMYKKQKKYDLAIEAFNRVIALEMDCVPAYIDRGDLFFETEKYEDAARDYQKAWEYDPDNEEIKAKLALAKEKTKFISGDNS